MGKGEERGRRGGGEGEGKEGRGRERKEEFIPQCSLAVDATAYGCIANACRWTEIPVSCLVWRDVK